MTYRLLNLKYTRTNSQYLISGEEVGPVYTLHAFQYEITCYSVLIQYQISMN